MRVLSTILLTTIAVSAFLFTAVSVRGQGVASRGVRPSARSKPSGRPFNARFVDVAAAAGLTKPVVYGGVDEKEYILETIGSGAAWLDYDDDGWQDLLLLSGSRLDDPPDEAINRLYHNRGDGTFEDVTESSGLGRAGWASSVTVGDYNGDGRDDLFITYWGQNVLYRSRGNGAYEDVTEAAGLLEEEVRWGSGATFLDYDRDGDLDLFVANYLDFDLERTPKKGSSGLCRWKEVAVNCGPRGLPTGRHSLYRNNGEGTFTDVTQESGISRAEPGYGMTAVAADFDGDGWIDIYLACDGTPSLLYRNEGGKRFSEEGLPRGVALSQDGLEQAGMGLGIGDYDVNGELDIFKTHFAEDTNVLYRNEGGGIFEDVTIRAGLAVETRFVGWGAAIVDLDNDGLPDIFYATGGIYPEVERALNIPQKTPSIVFRNLDGRRFEELLSGAGPGVAELHSSRGATFADYDNDGDMDILVVNLNEPPSLLRNDLSGDAGWLKIELRGKPGRSIMGTQVTAVYGDRRQKQVVLAQSSFYSVNDQRLNFGLGGARSADLEIRWPDGSDQTINDVAAGQWVVIEQGKGLARVSRTRN